jgi:PBSX family phage terminase large subunit
MTQAIVRRYKARGAALELLKCRDPEVLIAGPAGTGKSRAALEKVHMMCLLNGACPKDCDEEHEHKSGMKALIVRKTLISLTSTGIVTFKEHVAKEALDTGLLRFYGGSRDEPPQYRYSNGSRLMLGGMDNPTKVMSSEYDLIFVQEATELTPTDWEKLSSRLRNGRVSFQQLLADCNPEQPDHWLKARCDRGDTTMLYGKHTDNPILFNDDETPTDRGQLYLERLSKLTGVRKLRLLGGVWAAAEGVIYEDWDPTKHISYRKRLPKDWERYWAIDFGYTNPFCWQQWALDPDGRAYLELEIYRTKRIVTDHIHQIMNLMLTKEGARPAGEWKYPKPTKIICDHDAEDRASLERELRTTYAWAGIATTAAKKDVKPGIEVVQLRMRLAGDGQPRMFICADALVDRDEEYAELGNPLGFKGEVSGYVWKPGLDGKPIPDEPLKMNDHSMDTARYFFAELDLRGQSRVRFL